MKHRPASGVAAPHQRLVRRVVPANSRACSELSTVGPDSGSVLPATSGVKIRVVAPATPANLNMYAGIMALPVAEISV